MDTEGKSGTFVRGLPTSGQSGSGQTTGGPSAGRSFLLDVAVAGLQEISIAFANGHNQSVHSVLTVNGSSVETTTFAPTGSWTTFANHVAYVDLPEGVHVLAFMSDNGAGADINAVSNLGPSSGGKSARSILTRASLAGMNIAAVGAVALAMNAGSHYANEPLPQTDANPDDDKPSAPQNLEVARLGPSEEGTGAAPVSPAAATGDGANDGWSDPGVEDESDYGVVPQGSADSPAMPGLFYNLAGSDDPSVPVFEGDDTEVSAGFVPMGMGNAPSALFMPNSGDLSFSPQQTDEPNELIDDGGDGTGTGTGTGPNTPQPPVDSGDDDAGGNDDGDDDDDDEDDSAGGDGDEGGASFPLRIQAENATLGFTTGNIATAPVVVTVQSASQSDVPYADAADGDAYVDFAGYNGNVNSGSGQYIEWTFTVEEAGYYDLDVGYSFNSVGVANRPMRMDVNGSLWDRVFDFRSTGSNEVYSESETRVYLNAGENSVRLTANGFSGPNIDYLEVRPADPNVVVIQAETLVQQVGANTDGTINRPISPNNTPSNEIFRFGAEDEAYLDWAIVSASVGNTPDLGIPVTVAVAGTYTFAVTYVNGGTIDRPLKLYHDSTDGTPAAELRFPTTKPNALTALPTDVSDLGTTPIAAPGANGLAVGWEGWSVETVTIHLNAGLNNLILSGKGVITGPNIDKFVISLVEADAPTNSAPLALDGTVLGTEDQVLTIDLANYISDAQDTDSQLTIVANVAPEQGTLSREGTILTFTPAADFHGTATITYTVTDRGGLSAEGSVTVNVGSVNDAPSVANFGGDLSFSDAIAAGDVLGRVSSTDVDGDHLTYSVNDERFVINQAGQLVVADGATFDAALEPNISLIVTTNDGELSSEATIVFAVSPSVAPPVDPTEPVESQALIFETAGLTPYSAYDGGPGGSITDGGTTINLDGNFWKRAPLEHSFTITENTKLTLTVTIGTYLPEIVAIGFDDDENPFEASDRSIFQLAGTQSQASFVDLRDGAPGQPGQVITVTIDLSAHAGKTIGSLVFIADDDVTSNGLGSAKFSSISVYDSVPENTEPVVIAGGFVDMSVNERSNIEVDLPFSDPDGDVLQYQVAVKDGLGNPASGFAGLSFVDGALVGTVGALPGTYTVTVQADDGRGGVVSSSFTLTVQNVNDAPTANTSIQYEPLEASLGMDVELSLQDFRDAFSDVDGDTLTLSVEGLPDGLSLNSDGVIVGKPTLPGIGTLTIVATDPGGLSTSIQIPYVVDGQLPGPKSFTLEAESFTGLDTAVGFFTGPAPDASGSQMIRTNANESGSVTTTFGQTGITAGWYTVSLTVFDENDGTAEFSLKIGDVVLADLLTFDDNGSFVNPSSPRGSAAQKGNLKTISFETPVYIDANTIAELTGKADAGELLRIDRLTLTETQAPSEQAPSAITLSNTSVSENNAGALIGTLSAQDPDGDSTAIVYSTDDERFVIVGNELRLADGVTFDHEEMASTTVLVTATDEQGKTTDSVLVVSVTDVNEAPQLASDAAIEDLTLSAGEVVTIDLAAVLRASDPDAGATVTYVVTAQDGSAAPAGVSVVDGKLVIDGSLAAGTHGFAVYATDGQLSSSPVNFTVVVTAPAAFVPITLQAEDALLTVLDNDANLTDTTIRDPDNIETGTTGLINGLRPDFSGTGYLDFGDFPGDSITFTVTVSAAGSYDLNVRYASMGPRPLSLAINNGAANTMAFVDTAVPAQGGQAAIEAFNNWEFSTTTVQLAAGVNTIKLSIPAGANTGPNIDRIEITEAGTGPIALDTSADADEIPLFLRGPTDPLSGAAADSINFSLAGIDSDIVKVEMSFDGGATRVTVLPDADGDYTVDGSALPPGSYSPIAYVTDAAGNEASVGTQIVIAGDTPVVVAPFTIQAEDLTKVTVHDTGTGDSDPSLTRPVTTDRRDTSGNFRQGSVGDSYMDFGTNAGDAITLSVDAPAAGTYLLTIRYANGGGADRPLDFTLNGQAIEKLSFAPGAATGTGTTQTAWDTWLDKVVEVTLVEGQNQLRFAIPAGAIAGPNFDQFKFEFVPDQPGEEEPQAFYLKIEGETFAIADVEANSATPADTKHRTPTVKEDGATAANSGPGLAFDANGLRPGYEGDGYLDMGNDIGDKASFDVTVETAGTYQLTFRYANGGADVRPMLMDIDGVTTSINFAPTAEQGSLAETGWGVWKTITVDVELAAGSNKISLANTIANGPNIDNVIISREGTTDPVETRDLIRFEEVVKINFEPSPTQSANGLPTGYQTPTGYLADTGAAFGDRGNGLSYGWVTEASVADGTANGTIAAAQPANAHWYKGTVGSASDLQKTYAHFEYPGAGGDNARAWEMALENGTYQVTMSIGDTAGAFDSSYVINLEGVNVMPTWVPANPQNNSQNGGGFRSTLVTTTVTVTDGRLTLDSIGGVNTEIQYLEVERIPDTTPNDGRSADLDFSYFVNPVANSLEDGRKSIAIGENGSLPTDIDPTATFVVGVQLQADGNRGPNIAHTQNVKLVETLTGIEVPIAVQISGGADTLNVRPLQNLKEFTSYTLKIQDVMDLGSIDNPNGALKQFQDLTTTFVTGETPVDVPREVAFQTDVLLNGFADGAGGFTSVEFGPDGKLYVATIMGVIHRWDVNSDGSINKSSIETLTLDYLDAGGGERRGIVGFVFDPEDPNTIWISDNAPIPRESKSFNTAEFSGRVSKITLGEGGDLATATAETYLTGLPRSGGDHLTNSLEFRLNPAYTSSNGEPEYLLYVSQGSNSAAGAADNAWGNRPERLLNAAILEIDPTRTPPNGGFNVQTEPSGSTPSYQAPASSFNADGTYTGYYNPFADDAVLKIFATGVRNAYDLVWHSNGQLYVPTNGTASGGKTPTDPTQPGLDTTVGNSPTQRDYLFIVEEGKYYGHPNPVRDEYILNGGNPTGGRDPHEVVGGNDGNPNTDGYQTGVQTDPNYDLDGVFDLGYNKSPNGAVEYTGNAFGSNLKGAVLFAQFSVGDNIRYVRVGENGDVIGEGVLRRPDGSVIDDYIDPLDIIQHPITGQLYLMTMNRSNGASQLVLLTPAPGGVTVDITADQGNDLALVALDVSDPALARFRVDGLDSDITTITLSVDGGPKTVVTLNAQKQFTFNLGDVEGAVNLSLEVTDAKLNKKAITLNVVTGEDVPPEEYVSLVTIQAEDKTPNDGTSVTAATGSSAQIQIRDASNREASTTVGTVDGLRPGAYGVDGNTDGTDGVPGGYADFGSTNADFLTFNFEVGADQAGASILRFRYANGSTADRPLQLEVNGTIIGLQSFVHAVTSGDDDPWNVWQIVEVPVVLIAGANSVTLRSVQNTGPNIDQLEVLVGKPVPTVPNDGEVVIDGTTYIKYEAEHADLGGAAIITENRNQSGDFVDYVGTANQSISWTVSALTDGTYGLDVIYALGQGKAARPMTLSVNGVVVQTLNFTANSNAGETIWAPLQTTIDLGAGTNVITLTAPLANGPNLDFIRVTKNALSTFEPDHAEIDGTGRIELEATDGSTNTFNGSTVEFYFSVADSGTYKLDVAANAGATNGQSLKWFLNGVEVDISAFPGAGTAGEESIYIQLTAGQDYQLKIVSNAPGASALDYLDIQSAPGNPNVDIQIQSLDAAYFDDRLHFSYLENPTGVSTVARDFKDTGTVRISNTGTEPLEIDGYSLTGPFTLQNPAALTDAVIAPGSYLDVTVLFNRAAYTRPSGDADLVSTIFEGQLKIITDDQDTPISTVKLAGFWQARDEGGQEPNVNEVWKVFGFGNHIDGISFNNGGEYGSLNKQGMYISSDETEVLSPYWKLADGVSEAKITQIAAFHGLGGADVGIHSPNSLGTQVSFWNHEGTDNQRLLPNAGNDNTFATKTFNRADIPDSWPGNDVFGIRVANNSTDPKLNAAGGSGPENVQRGQMVKMFQALDANGDVIPNVYLGIMDYPGINYDYNDNMFVIEGVQPVGSGADLSVTGLDDAAADDRLVFTNIDQPSNGQQVFRNEATFTIANDGIAVLNLTSLVLSDTSAFEFVGTVPTSVAVGGSVQVTIRFKGEHPGTNPGAELYNATLTINSNDFNGQQVIQLAGLAQEYSENGSEPTVTQIVEAFGYSTNIAEHLLANGGKVEAVGDEVLMPYLEKLDGSKSIEVIQIGAFLNQGNVARLGFHNINSSGVTNLFANDDQQGQTVLPDQLVTGTGSGANVARGVINQNAPFGLYISVDGRPTYSSWTDPNANNLDPNFGHLVSNEQGHLIRFFEAIDANGNVIAGTYIGIQDYPGAGNYDYNDHMFVITNVKPHTLTPANDANGDGINDALQLDADLDGIVNFFDNVTPPTNSTQTPYGGAAPSFTNGVLVVDATNFDNGGQGISWNDNPGLDNPTGNPTFRPGRDVELVGAGLDIGHVKPGEWVEYTINVPTAGVYSLTANAKTPVSGATIAVSLDGQTLLGTVALTDSHAGGSNFNNASFGNSAPITINLPAGVQTLRLTFDGPLASNGFVMDLASFTLTAPQGQQPFGGIAPVLDADGLVIQGVQYDEGGQGVAYNDAPGLSGGSNGGRSGSAVEVTTGGAIGWIANGEWLEYTINVAEAGTYGLNLLMSMVQGAQGPRSVTASFTNGSSVQSVTVDTPNTNDWLTFQNSATKNVELEAGVTVVRLTFAGDSQDLKSFSLQPVAQSPMLLSQNDDVQDNASPSFVQVDPTPDEANNHNPLHGYDLIV